MAHVQRRTQGGKTTWRARVGLPDGRERSRSFDRKVDAERWVVETQAELNRGNVIDPRAGQITLAEYSAQWQAAQAPAVNGRWLQPTGAAVAATFLCLAGSTYLGGDVDHPARGYHLASLVSAPLAVAAAIVVVTGFVRSRIRS